MSDFNPFSGGSSVQTLEWLKRFKVLDAKLDQGLTESEATEYDELLRKLSHILDPQSTKMAQRRKHLRVNTKLPVRFSSGEEFKKLYIENLSGGGVYIASDKALPSGSIVHIELTLDEEQQTIKVEGKVTWSNPKPQSKLPAGMGVQFINMDRKTEALIRKLVRSQLDDKMKS
jgi:uncharacterized protein (TIGR02266 family)